MSACVWLANVPMSPDVLYPMQSMTIIVQLTAKLPHRAVNKIT
ncbi:MAG: hypothetical protein OEL55_07340 [Desulfobulbaceae bacterium]|nr:hypothetical protein [Desulfobulbaceae bacterium]